MSPMSPSIQDEDHDAAKSSTMASKSERRDPVPGSDTCGRCSASTSTTSCALLDHRR
ncbi:hypothetical protein [Amycolatopsis sp. NPDC003731]